MNIRMVMLLILIFCFISFTTVVCANNPVVNTIPPHVSTSSDNIITKNLPLLDQYTKKFKNTVDVDKVNIQKRQNYVQFVNQSYFFDDNIKGSNKGLPITEPEPKIQNQSIMENVSIESGYNANNAVDYANTYWNKVNSNYNYYDGVDCANYVSQCLIAGGLYLDQYTDNKGSIINCDYLHAWLTNKGYKWTEILKTQNPKEPIWFVPGDVAIFGDSSDKYRHAVFAVTGDENNYATVNAHTVNQWHKTIQFFYDYSSWDRCTFYHIPNEVNSREYTFQTTDNAARINTGSGIVNSPWSASWSDGQVKVIAAETSFEKNNIKYSFSGWSGKSTSPIQVIQITTSSSSAGSYFANYARQFYLDIKTSPLGIGTISGTGWYDPGTQKSLTAPAVNGYRFVKWQKNGVDIGSSNPIFITMDNPYAVVAVYEQVSSTRQYTFQTNDNALSIICDGKANPSPWSVSWSDGQMKNIAVVAAQQFGDTLKYIFTGWSGKSTSSSNLLSITTSSSSAGSYIANYKKQIYVTVSTNPSGIGLISGSGWYDEGTLITLTAPIIPGYSFVKWQKNGDDIDTNNPVSTIVSYSIVAVYELSSSGLDNIGVFRSRIWYLDSMGNGAWGTGDSQKTFGLSGDIPLTGDWNGDRKSEIGVFRGNKWYLDYNENGIWNDPSIDRQYTFGLTGDKPVNGDWNGDGKAEIGVFRENMWYLDYNGNGKWDGSSIDRQYTFGLSGDIPVTGDWNGDDKTEIGVFRGNKWYLDYSGNGIWGSNDKTYNFGSSGDVPVTGDWNGDKEADIGVFRGRTWYLDFNGNGVWNGPSTDRLYIFGLTGDIPVTGKWSGTSGTASILSLEENPVKKPDSVIKVPDVTRPVAAVPKVEMPVRSSQAVSPSTGRIHPGPNPLAAGSEARIVERNVI